MDIDKTMTIIIVLSMFVVGAYLIPGCISESNADPRFDRVLKSPDSVTLVYGENIERFIESQNMSEYDATISWAFGKPTYKFDIEYIDGDSNKQKTVIISPKRIDFDDGGLIIYV